MRLALILLQAAGPPAPASPPLTIDLLQRQAPACDAGDTDDIVVCGRLDPEAHRLRPVATVDDPLPIPKAEVGLFGKVRMAAEAEAAGLGPAGKTERLMLRLKMPF